MRKSILLCFSILLLSCGVPVNNLSGVGDPAVDSSKIAYEAYRIALMAGGVWTGTGESAESVKTTVGMQTPAGVILPQSVIDSENIFLSSFRSSSQYSQFGQAPNRNKLFEADKIKNALQKGSRTITDGSVCDSGGTYTLKASFDSPQTVVTHEEFVNCTKSISLGQFPVKLVWDEIRDNEMTDPAYTGGNPISGDPDTSIYDGSFDAAFKWTRKSKGIMRYYDQETGGLVREEEWDIEEVNECSERCAEPKFGTTAVETTKTLTNGFNRFYNPRTRVQNWEQHTITTTENLYTESVYTVNEAGTIQTLPSASIRSGKESLTDLLDPSHSYDVEYNNFKTTYHQDGEGLDAARGFSEIEGSIISDCNEIKIETLEPIVYDIEHGNFTCPIAGRVRYSTSEGDVVFEHTDNNGIQIDLNADGYFDKHIKSCIELSGRLSDSSESGCVNPGSLENTSK